MRITEWLVVTALLVGLAGCSSLQHKSTQELEEETMQAMNKWFENKDVSSDELQTSFENYFTSNGITETTDSEQEQYMDILSFIREPDGFPPLKDKRKVLGMMKGLDINSQDLERKNHLDYFYDIYLENKDAVDTTSTYYVFGATIETLHKIPRLSSPGLIAKTLQNQMEQADLNKELYQKTVMLLFYFDMAMHLRGKR